MKSSSIVLASAINWSSETLSLLKKAQLQWEDVEEALLNLPTIKKITLSFPDGHERFFIEGLTDRGKKIQLVGFISKALLHITYIQTS